MECISYTFDSDSFKPACVCAFLFVCVSAEAIKDFWLENKRTAAINTRNNLHAIDVIVWSCNVVQAN